MKIAFVMLYNRIGGTAGDCVQFEKTSESLRTLGEDVLQCYLKPDNEGVYDANGQRIGLWKDVLADRDIIHCMLPSSFLPKHPLNAKMVCSTIFWRSWTCTRVMFRNQGCLTWHTVKLAVRDFFAWFGVPTFGLYRRYDLLLPNSQDEAVNVRQYCKIKKNAEFWVVPNAIDPVPDFVALLPRPDCVPDGDYVLVPAFFAARKNQLTLIKAMKSSERPIVFMGDGSCLLRCQHEAAGSNMHFLGHVEHGSKKFYAVMKYARVVCLPSNCETPGIAGLEAAALGARPVVPQEGGTAQYYGWDAEYIDPLNGVSIRRAIERAWNRGRLDDEHRAKYEHMTWKSVGETTRHAYRMILKQQGNG